MDTGKLESTAKAMTAPGKGLLAADESTGTIKKRFDTIGVESTASSRQTYRNMLFTADGIADHIGGVILYDETVRQSSAGGVPFPQLLAGIGIEPGIKVDMGAKDMDGHPGEKLTSGLDGLGERLSEYAGLGLTFAKWRAVITIGSDIPSEACIASNAEALASYAASCQEAGIVPIVEPEVLMDGDHTIGRCRIVTEQTLKVVFEALATHGVHLPGIILKPNMVISGSDCPEQAGPDEVARQTVEVLSALVPAEVPGIAFLSGGQTEEQATLHLQAMNALDGIKKPWRLTFSYGRALQAAALKSWSGQAAQLAAGQQAFMHRARMNGAAAEGTYAVEMEAAA